MDYEEGNYSQAEENLRKTIELNPADVDAYKILAQLIAKTGYYSDAENMVLQAMNNCGESGDLYYLAGEITKTQGDIEKSKNYFNKALANSKTLSLSIDKVQAIISSL